MAKRQAEGLPGVQGTSGRRLVRP